MTITPKQLLDAIHDMDLKLIRTLLDQGANVNACNDYGESVLNEATLMLLDDPDRYDVISLLLDRGADPRILDQERGGPLQNAMLTMDTRLLALLLDHGADPNREAGFVDTETLYDWAESDYRYKMNALTLPEKPSPSDEADEDSWLAFLQQLAKKYHWKPPAHLILLRERGARTAEELRASI